jgi:hypothetical protein
MPSEGRISSAGWIKNRTFKCFRTDFRTDGFSGWVTTQVIVFIGGTAGHRIVELSLFLSLFIKAFLLFRL